MGLLNQVCFSWARMGWSDIQISFWPRSSQLPVCPISSSESSCFILTELGLS